MPSKRISNSYVISQALKQSWWRLSTDLGQIPRAIFLRAGLVEPFHNIFIPNIRGDETVGDRLVAGRFKYSEKHLDIGRNGDPWPLAAPSERFAHWLHSFNWLDDLLASKDPSARIRARELTNQWIASFGDWNSYSWDNEIIANRLFNWLSHWSEAMTTDSLEKTGQKRRASVYRQLKQLRRTYSRTTPGLPKLKAAVVIALGGLFMARRNEAFIGQGLDWIDIEIDTQILPDGGHISRSPEETMEALNLLSVLMRALNKRGVSSTNTLERAIERLRHMLVFFVMPDGRLPSFNGGGLGNPTLTSNLIKQIEKPGKPFSYCPYTGYQRLESGNTLIIMDTGAPPPVPYDQHAHLGPLAFELTTGKNRLFVNCGWSEEQPLAWKQSVRQTAAHSSLILNNASCGQFSETGMAGKVMPDHILSGPSQVSAGRKEQLEGNWLETSHDGYVSTSGLTVRRRLYMNSAGTDIRGEDSLLIPLGQQAVMQRTLPFDIRFHLHPNVRATLSQDLSSALLIQPGQVAWRFRTDAGPIRIESSVYLADGSRPVRTEQLVISGLANTDSDGESATNRVRWSVKRLQKRT